VPEELFRESVRCDEILPHLIESAAVHLPSLAALPLGEVARGPQARIDVHEIEGCTDPSHAGDDVEPAEEKARPLD
jgi:hypothetical protein